MKILLLVIVSFVHLFASSQSDNEKYWNWVDSVVAVINNQIAENDYDNANKNSDILLSVYSGKEAHLLKATSVMKGKRTFMNDIDVFNTALFHLGESLKLDSSYNLAFGRKGLLYFVYGDFKNSILFHTKFIKYSSSDKDLFNGYTDRGTAKSFGGDIEGAIADYYKAMEYDSTHSSIFQNLGSFLINEKRYEEAESILLKGINLYPNDDGMLNNLGFLYLSQENYKAAIKCFDRTIESNDNDYLAYGNRGFCKMKLASFKEAESDLNKSKSINPENSYLYKYLGLFYIEIDNQAKACSMFQKAIDLGFTKLYGNEVNNLIKQYCDS